MKPTILSIFFGIFLLISPTLSFSKPLSPDEVPEPLKPWVDWVLDGYEQKKCPSLYNDSATHRCAWPPRLETRISRQGGEFSQGWNVMLDGWIILPGDREHWPRDVRVNQKPATVTERKGLPMVYVKAGEHKITGSFSWEKRPEFLQVPSHTGLISLWINGKELTFPELDKGGKLWLRTRDGEESKNKPEQEDHLEIQVFRKIVDEIPLQVITRLELNVSGKNRELLLGPVFTKDYLPIQLKSPLPAKVEADGGIRLQARAGRWTVILSARSLGPVHAITPPPAIEPWPGEEIWVFEAKPQLRMAAMEGVPAIDPQQTNLPGEWTNLPAYRVTAGNTLKLVEKKRGDPDPAPDQLTLKREIWLDFSGDGYTIQDRISGSMRRGWRLEMNPPAALGRVSMDGKDQFITRVTENGREGVEVRKGSVRLTADIRLEGTQREIPAMGWNHDFHQVSGELHLPPGWELLDASGMDDMPGTWLKMWNLLDLFIVLIIALSISRLWGKPWGLLALLTLGIIYHEPDSPGWIWLHLLAATALLRVIPEGKLQRLLRLYGFLALLTLIVFSIPFMVDQTRRGLYPQLEKPWQGVEGEGFREVEQWDMGLAKKPKAMVPQVAQAPMMDEEKLYLDEADPAGAAKQSHIKRARKKSYRAQGKGALSSLRKMVRQYDPKAAIQTGPGLPEWRWNSYSFSWNGPVDRAQELRLILIPPRLNMFLCFLRAALLAILVLKLILACWAWRGGTSPNGSGAGIAAVALLLFLAVTPFATAHADIPSHKLLSELRSRLLKPPECAPRCADSPRLRLELHPEKLVARMEVHAYAEVSVPLPGEVGHWLPVMVLLNGEPAGELNRSAKGHLWIKIPKGRNEILMEGPLPPRKTVQLPLPLNPHFVEVKAEGWTIEGLRDNGLTDGRLQFQRIRTKEAPEKTLAFEPTALPSFVRVERELHFGLTWQVQTTVTRLTPMGMAVMLEVPLLEGESVISEKVRVKENKAVVNMGPMEKTALWHSVLETRDNIELKSMDTTSWTEVWRLDISPIWRPEIKGIPPIHHQNSRGAWLPEWRPWPGETLSIGLARPEGIPGRTLTVDNSLLEVTPGKRATDVKLTVTLRSSRGGQHTVKLSPDAKLLEAKINGSTMPIRQEGNSVTIPLAPGKRNVELLWRSPEGVKSHFTTPLVDLGISSVNTKIRVNTPEDRWILFTGGPDMGPAVLLWGILLVLIFLAIGLGRVPFTPMKSHQWFLLGVGLSQLPVLPALTVVFWLLALGWRKGLSEDTGKGLFNMVQIGLVVLTMAALFSLFEGISQGLLGSPEMRIAGNRSTHAMLRWYQDRSGPGLPTAWFISVPLTAYRLLMLAWSLWLASSLIKWFKWGWECFSATGVWRPLKPFFIWKWWKERKKGKS